MEREELQEWRTLSRSVLLDRSPYLVVEEHTVELPDGRVLEDWPWLVTPDFAIVVAVTPEDRFLCFRQTKYAVQGVTLAPVGGYLDAGEEPLVAARRELLEETGCRAPEWIELGHYPVDGNRGAGMAHLFLARGVYPVQPPDADDLEEQQFLTLSREEVAAALSAGRFKLLPWAAAIALALLHLGCAG